MAKSEKISFTYNQNIDLVTKELENTKIGEEAGTKITGRRNIILGKDAAYNSIDINDSIITGYSAGFNLTSSCSNLIYITNKSLKNVNNNNNSTVIGSELLKKFIKGNNNLITGFNQLNNITSNIIDTITYGNNIGNNLINSKNNIVIGCDNLSNVTTAFNNIVIGNNNKNLNNINNDIINIGNLNSLNNNPLIIGNNNTITSKSTKSIGNNLKSLNKLIAYNHLNNYDDILNSNIVNSLNLCNLIVDPIENYIFKSPYNPLEISINNNLNLKKINFTFDTFTNVNQGNDENYIYNITYSLTNNLNDIYRFIEPSILYFNFSTNFIKLEYDNIDKNINYKILITQLPKYNFIKKTLYNLNEIIVLEPYQEYKHIKSDNFKVKFIINYENISYESRYEFTINVYKTTINDKFIPIIFYSSLISFDWFNTTLNINKLNSDIVINNQPTIYQNLEINEDFLVYGNSILINDKLVNIITIKDNYDVNINLIWYLFSNNLFYISEHIVNGFIYIEKPPKNNLITSNLIQINNNIVNFDYFLNINESDTMTVRIINPDKTKISKSFNIIIKNYIVNRLSLTNDLINDNFYIDNDKINNIVDDYLLFLVNNCNLIATYEFIKFEKQIINTIENNLINVDIYPFNQISIYDALIENNFKNIQQSNIYILNDSKLENGYIVERNYINYRNINDSIKILIALNRLNYNVDNIYEIKFNVINNFEIEYYSQYIYNNKELLKTLNVVNHPKNKIQIYENNELSILSLKEIDETFNNFKIIFGDKVVNLNLDFYPTINDFSVFYNKYYFKQLFNINEIKKQHKIEYIFKNIENFRISLNIFIKLIESYNVPELKKYNFKIILNNDVVLLYNENSSLEYNILNTIVIDNKLVKTLNNLQIIYNLSDNLINNNSNLINYFLEIDFSDLIVEYDINLGNNLLFGENVECKGYDNIGIGSLYNLYGNDSIIIGNHIGNDFINNSVIIGNNNLKTVIPRNVIMIGNNNYNDIKNTLNFDRIAKKNPIIIGNNLKFSKDLILNINDTILEKNDKIIIKKKSIIIGNKFNNLIYPTSLQLDRFHLERLILDNNDISLINFDIDILEYFEELNYNNGILAPNGNIYYIPNKNNGKIVYYNKNLNKLSDISINLFGSELYSNGVLGANGKIYFVPFLANNIGVLDLKTNKFNIIDISKYFTINLKKYISGVLAQNGKIYFIPYNADNIGELDILSEKFNIIKLNLNINYMFNGGILAPNGNIYMIPYNFNNIGVFDTVLNKFTIKQIIINDKNYNLGNFKGNSILYLPNGGIFIINNEIAISFDPLTMNGKLYNNLNSKNVINLVINGRLYGIDNAELFELLITKDEKIKYNLPYNIKSKRLILGLDNKLYSVPNNENKVYIIKLDIDNFIEFDIEGGIPDNWISLLSPYFNHN